MAGRVGQVFVMAAVVFSALVLLAFLPIGPTLSRVADPNFRLYFGQAFTETSEAYNDALADNRSATHVKRELYSYNRFVDARSGDKGIDYRSYQFAVLPQKGEAVFINYLDSDADARIYVDGSWTNQTVEAKQSVTVRFSPGKVHAGLELPGRGDSYSMDLASPRIIYWTEMQTPSETWENSYLG